MKEQYSFCFQSTAPFCRKESREREKLGRRARGEKGGFVSHVATTCLLSTSPPALFPDSMKSLVLQSLVTTAITTITADQIQYNRYHFNLCYQSFYVLSFYCFLNCLFLLSRLHLQIVFLSINVSRSILKCFICNSKGLFIEGSILLSSAYSRLLLLIVIIS